MQASNLFSLFIEVGAWAQAHTTLVLFAMLLPVVYVGVMSVARCYRKRGGG
jgi:hypothetical protein